MGEGERITSIYIDGCEIKGISDFSVESDEIEKYVKENTVLRFSDCLTMTATCKINRMAFYKFIGLWDWAIENCPNKRVVHLMRYGKNNKVKMKNFRRSLRIIEKVLR
jgi:hypothetical protein